MSSLSKKIKNKMEYLRLRIGRVIASLVHKEQNADTDADTLSIVAIIKNEAAYIEEWVRYHLIIGVDYFFLYDNGSTDNTIDLLKKYIEFGVVTLTEFPGQGMQLPAYNDALKRFGSRTKYMAFIDADEFLYSCDKTKSVKQQVEEIFSLYPNVGGLAVNWRMFGSSGHVSKPEGGYWRTSCTVPGMMARVTTA